MQRKDFVFKRFIREPGLFADLVNGIFFSGASVIQPDFLKRVPLQRILRLETIYTKEDCAFPMESMDKDFPAKSGGEIEKTSGEAFPGGEPKDSLWQKLYLDVERDCLWQYTHPDMPCFLACESQSQADYTMPLRECIYDSADYGGQMEEQSSPRKDESGISRPLLPVFSMVLYLGERKWLSKHSLQEMMYFTEKSKSYRHLLPDYKVHLADIHEQDPSLFHTEWKEIFSLMAHSRKKEELKSYIAAHQEELNALSPSAQEFILVLLDCNEYSLTQFEKGEISVCKAWDEAMEDYKKEGEIIGKIIGKIEGEIRGEIRGKIIGEIEGEMKSTIRILQEFGTSKESILDRLTKQFQLSRSDAEEKFALYSASPIS